MADIAHKRTDKYIDEIEKRVRKEYNQARKETQAKMNTYLAKVADDAEKERQKMLAGEITPQEYNDWMTRKVAMGKRWEELRDNLSDDLNNANNIARSIADGYRPDVYALNHNYAVYLAEHGAKCETVYQLYDRPTVERLLREDQNLMPPPGRKMRADIRAGRAAKWNYQNLQSAVTQSILQGDTIPQMAQRVANTVATRSYKDAVRYARTMMTGAQNAGRQDGYKNAEELGIKLKKEWVATLDDRTRASHASLHGERVSVDEKFSNGLMYPGDPAGDPSEVYNCFVPGTIVTTDCDIEKSYCHPYEGDVLTIKTAGGVCFTCTPNHPIMSVKGWVRANALHEGDDLLVTRGINREFSRRYPNINHIHARIDTIHELFDKFGGERRRGLSVNFHGDRATANVEVISAKGFLREDGNPCGVQGFNKFGFESPDSLGGRTRHFGKSFFGVDVSSLGLMGRFGKTLSFFRRGLRHSKIHGFRAVSGDDPGVTKDSVYDLPGKAVRLGERLDGFTGEVARDKIVSIEISAFSGHVYNLQTRNGYYYVNSSITDSGSSDNGIYAIVHNCRCTTVAQIDGYETDKVKYSPKMGDMDFDEWLESRGATRRGPERPTARVFPSGAAANAYFGERPERALRRENRELYDEKMEEYRNSMFGSWRDGLDVEQEVSIGMYSGDSYAGINGLLRGEMTEKQVALWDATEDEKYTIQKIIPRIESAINDFDLKEPIKVFRTCDPDFLLLNDISVGKTFQDKGFVSSSILQEKVASGNVFMEIDVPAGKGVGAWINPLSGAQDEEYEFLLQRGSIFEVDAIEARGDDTVIKIRWVDAQPQEIKYATKEHVIDLWKKRGLYDEENAKKI